MANNCPPSHLITLRFHLSSCETAHWHPRYADSRVHQVFQLHGQSVLLLKAYISLDPAFLCFPLAVASVLRIFKPRGPHARQQGTRTSSRRPSADRSWNTGFAIFPTSHSLKANHPVSITSHQVGGPHLADGFLSSFTPRPLAGPSWSEQATAVTGLSRDYKLPILIAHPE